MWSWERYRGGRERAEEDMLGEVDGKWTRRGGKREVGWDDIERKKWRIEEEAKAEDESGVLSLSMMTYRNHFCLYCCSWQKLGIAHTISTITMVILAR